MKTIRAIYCDNEGCILPGKGLPFPLMELNELRSFLEEHSSVKFGICTGRSIPFVEAMVQVLNLLQSTLPCICEGGATLYWPANDRWEKISDFPVKDRNILFHAVEGLNYREEPGKVICLSLYPDPPTTVNDLYEAFIKSIEPNLVHITKSEAAVDITPAGIDKSYGVKAVCRRLNISLDEILYIGDERNDLVMLELAGYSGCPSNASAEVKNVADFVASHPSTRGVLEILRHFEPLFERNSQT
jgi:hydroxymethylpyrimidine pyrophosphatase-like HAD family hydrolase